MLHLLLFTAVYDIFMLNKWTCLFENPLRSAENAYTSFVVLFRFFTAEGSTSLFVRVSTKCLKKEIWFIMHFIIFFISPDLDQIEYKICSSKEN